MSAEGFRLLNISVNKWARSDQDREELFTLCCENYFFRTANKEIKKDTEYLYLSVLFRNTCIDFLRKKSRVEKYEFLSSDLSCEGLSKSEFESFVEPSFDPYIESNSKLFMEHFLANLSDSDSKVIKGLLVGDSYKELSGAINSSINVIKWSLFRYRRKLRNILKNKNWFECLDQNQSTADYIVRFK